MAVQMKENMSIYLKEIMPTLFIMIKKIISEDDVDIGLGVNQTDENSSWMKKMNVVTSNSEEAEVAINMLTVFIQEIPHGMY